MRLRAREIRPGDVLVGKYTITKIEPEVSSLRSMRPMLRLVFAPGKAWLVRPSTFFDVERSDPGPVTAERLRSKT